MPLYNRINSSRSNRHVLHSSRSNLINLLLTQRLYAEHDIERRGHAQDDRQVGVEHATLERRLLQAGDEVEVGGELGLLQGGFVRSRIPARGAARAEPVEEAVVDGDR